MTQIARNVDALFAALQSRFDDTPRTNFIESAASCAAKGLQISALACGSPNFGNAMGEVKALIVHFTDGNPSAYEAKDFIQRYQYDDYPTDYSNPNHPVDNRTIGPQLYIDTTGMLFRFLSENRATNHAIGLNTSAIGIETAHRGTTFDAAPAGQKINHENGWNRWYPLSDNWTDVPLEAFQLFLPEMLVKFFAYRHVRNENFHNPPPTKNFAHDEIIVAPWFVNPPIFVDAEDNAGVGTAMCFTDEQYTTWARTARWVAEKWAIPRMFLYRPHVNGYSRHADGALFRELLDAEPMKDMFVRKHFVITQGGKTVNNYDPGLFPQFYQVNGNDLWTALFTEYRGIFSHAFASVTSHQYHNCPSPWFDWHRFARSVWDYWWYPLDLDDDGAPSTSLRPSSTSNAHLKEYYFNRTADPYYRRTSRGFFGIASEPTNIFQPADKYMGLPHGGMHFELTNGSPLYAVANGHVVAARFAKPTLRSDWQSQNDIRIDTASSSFVLLRHEVFHRRQGDVLDYSQAPSIVYSLYMHVLGDPDSTHTETYNPSWLNRAIIRKQEATLGSQFFLKNPATGWNMRLLDRWNTDLSTLTVALQRLEAGDIAVFPAGEHAVPVLLGDFIARAGQMASQGFGVHLEIFSLDQVFNRPDDIVQDFTFEDFGAMSPFFSEDSIDKFDQFFKDRIRETIDPQGTIQDFRRLEAIWKAHFFENAVLRFPTEWSLEKADFDALGMNWDNFKDFMWWNDVAQLGWGAQDGWQRRQAVWHYHPLQFLSVLNRVTWAHEWTKFKIVDANNQPVPRQPFPRR